MECSEEGHVGVQHPIQGELCNCVQCSELATFVVLLNSAVDCHGARSAVFYFQFFLFDFFYEPSPVCPRSPFLYSEYTMKTGKDFLDPQ